jgi:heat shock protein HslJ
MRSHRGILSVVALIAALALSACGSAGSSAGAPTYTDLVDRVFIDSSTQPPIEMTFLADSFAVNAGCNTLAGGATITDGVFTLDGPLASTKMACEESLMQRDDELAQFLASSPTVTLDGATLTMTSGDSSFTFVESTQ